MTTLRPHARLALAALVLVATPRPSASQVCDDPTARNLYFTSWINSALNPPKQEDVEFFVRQGGLPNALLVIDTSGSMVRLPPDGPQTLGGGVSAIPPGFPLLGAARTNLTAQTNAMNATAAVRPVGCGLDDYSAALPNFLDNPQLRTVVDRRFNPPCGNAVDPALVGSPYADHSTDYPQEMTVCPYFTTTNSQATGAPGFDPDFYAASDALTTGTRPNLFPRNLIFHDVNLNQATNAWSSTLAFRNNLGDGWTNTAVFPSRSSSTTFDDISSFCARQGTEMQGTRTREDICNQCLTEAGWYYDGLILDTTDNGIYYQFPSLWYTGNYLSFFPPKFVMARKVLKDLIAVQSRVRLAMSRFDAAGSTVIQSFKPTCGDPDNTTFDASRSAYVTSVNGLAFSGGTPLSRALFDAGRYVHSPDLPWFGATWENAGKESSSTTSLSAVCYSCQTSSIILITDGQPNAADGNGTHLPPGGLTAAQLTGAYYAGNASTGIQGISAAVCPQCNAFLPADDYRNNTIKTAFYLHNMDLRRNDETTLDCKGNGGKQKTDIYTVGFGTSTLDSANTILVNAAAAGGGSFVPAEDSSSLKQGLVNILEQINTRATSFSVATVSTLQTTAGRSVIVPRFDPAKTSIWRGHLSRFDLYSEFVNTCEGRPSGDGVGDYDCDGKCNSVFLQDKDGDFITEDANGVFRKNDPPNLPTCESAPICQANSRPCAVAGTALASYWWDAGEDLVARTWQSRHVYTAVDENLDGRIDQADGTLKLETATDTAAQKLVPYLGLGTPATTLGVCEILSNRLNGVGANLWGADVAASKVECAKAIIRYLKGADLFNEKADPSFPPGSMESANDRPFKLGDIFHSSPVLVEPPFPSDGVMCRLGLTNQCLQSLWQTPTPHAGVNAYDEFQTSADYQYRRKIVLVGANDGLIHAFNGGTWRGGTDDPTTTALDESQPPFNGYYERGDLSGGAEELWAFLPPGLIGKLPLLLGAEHQLYADGSPMVRDVWVDGSTNGLAGATARDDEKQQQEFHTLAVVPLRRGGTHFFALDITNSTEPDAPPQFLWMYPQPGDPRSLTFGESYDSFLPRPPPVGPVRIRADANGGPANANTPIWSQAGGGATPYHERWVAFLNGGFDPQYVRGRGVYMVDVWTGELVWEFAYPLDPASADPADPRLQLRFPVASSVGMVPWGQEPKRKPGETNDFFFDTATFGDTGGQIWTLRFSEPGQLDASGQASNWFGGRAFQMGGPASCKLCGGHPFFYMTANLAIPESSYLRIFAGTGDRFNLLDKGGGVCGPDNLRACVMRGCTVSLSLANNRLGSPDLGQQNWSMSQTACNAMSVGGSTGALATCAAQGKVSVTISGCPSPSPAGAPTSTYKTIDVSCANQADGEYACSKLQNDQGTKLSLSDTANAPNVGNWFFSLLGFTENGARAIFTTYAQAKAYDTARLWVTQAGNARNSSGLVLMAATDDAPSTVATATSNGWAIYYDHGPTVTADGHVYTVNWMDERTSAGSATRSNLVTWSSIQSTTGEVTSSSGSCRTAQCTAVDRRVSYHYAADSKTGRPLFEDPLSGVVVRAYTGTHLVPPQGDQTTVFVNQQGQVAVGLTSVSPERGATNVGMSDAKEPTYGLGVLEVSEQTHACRHSWSGSESNPVGVPPPQEACR